MAIGLARCETRSSAVARTRASGSIRACASPSSTTAPSNVASAAAAFARSVAPSVHTAPSPLSDEPSVVECCTQALDIAGLVELVDLRRAARKQTHALRIDRVLPSRRYCAPNVRRASLGPLAARIHQGPEAGRMHPVRQAGGGRRRVHVHRPPRRHLLRHPERVPVQQRARDDRALRAHRVARGARRRNGSRADAAHPPGHPRAQGGVRAGGIQRGR